MRVERLTEMKFIKSDLLDCGEIGSAKLFRYYEFFKGLLNGEILFCIILVIEITGNLGNVDRSSLQNYSPFQAFFQWEII